MFKRSLLITVLILSCYCSFAQRLSFADFCKLFEYTVDNSEHNVQDITAYLRANSEDWQGPRDSKTGDELHLTWTYKVNSSIMGYFQATKKPLASLNGSTGFIKKATYTFPYRVQYNEYLENISKYAELVNTFTENGATYSIYESSYLTWALIVIPPTRKDFFIDGLPVEHYMIEVHHKL